jgi:hypothetical protein
MVGKVSGDAERQPASHIGTSGRGSDVIVEVPYPLPGRVSGRRARGWRGVVEGDARAIAQLARLSRRDARWRCLCEIPLGVSGARVDHLVIGPGGVYTLSVSYHPGSRVLVRGNVFRVDGTACAFVSDIRHEALRASRGLTEACGFPVSVAGVLVLDGAEDVAVREAPCDVHIVNRRGLRSWLRRRDEVLDRRVISTVYDAALRPATWASFI